MNSPRPGWTPPIPVPPSGPPLVRATASSPDMPPPWLGGVCSGLAVHLRLPVALVRVLFVCLAAFGVGIGVYLWLWVTVPEDSPERSGEGALSPGLVRLREERAAQVSRNRLIVVGVALIVAAIVGTILNATGTLDWRDMGAIVSIISGVPGGHCASSALSSAA